MQLQHGSAPTAIAIIILFCTVAFILTPFVTGWLEDANSPNNPDEDKKFDSSVDRGMPFQFPLGMGRVIRGWDEGVALMKMGETRRLIIPANLG